MTPPWQCSLGRGESAGVPRRGRGNYEEQTVRPCGSAGMLQYLQADSPGPSSVFVGRMPRRWPPSSRRSADAVLPVANDRRVAIQCCPSRAPATIYISRY